MIVQHDSLELSELISTNSMLAIDTETTGLNTRREKVIGIGLSNATDSIYLPILNWDGATLQQITKPEDVKFVLLQLLFKKLITWNGSFDIRIIVSNFGINLSEALYADSMLLKHTVDEERPFKMKEVAKKVFGLDAAAEQIEMKESVKANGGAVNEFYKANLTVMAKYCEQDCKLTFRLFEHYSRQLKAQNLEKLFYEDEVMPLYKHVTIPMEMLGIPLDMSLLKQTVTEIKEDIKILESKTFVELTPQLGMFEAWVLGKKFPIKRTGNFAQTYAKYLNITLPLTKSGKYSLTAKNLKALGDCDFTKFMSGKVRLDDSIIHTIRLNMNNGAPTFNLNSKHHLKKLFFEVLKEVPLSKTKKGAPQVDDKFLKSMISKYKFVRFLRDYNKLRKLDGTYFSKFLETNEDGIFYPNFSQHKTTSGRYGSDIQQLPRQLEKSSKASDVVRKYTDLVRDLIVSPPGKVLVGADYSSLEVVVFADDAGDESLINMIKNNEDFYSRVAIDVLGLQQYSAIKDADDFLKNHKPEVRQTSKVYSLGLRYGMREFKLSKTLNISKEEASKLIHNYFKAYPKLKTRMDELTNSALKNGFVASKAGRIRHMPMLRKLHYSHGPVLGNSLDLWAKFHENPKLYEQMKYLSKQYTGAINNALNYPIQSMAASIVNRASIAINKQFKAEGLDALIMINIHDELVSLASVEHAERVREIMQDKMENTTKLDAPLTAIPEIGTRYSEIK